MEYTRFERARILGARALQIALGAPSLIDVPSLDALQLAWQELENAAVPIQVQRADRALR
jgi:DNA-directed RNA polymerase subunit K